MRNCESPKCEREATKLLRPDASFKTWVFCDAHASDFRAKFIERPGNSASIFEATIKPSR